VLLTTEIKIHEIKRLVVNWLDLAVAKTTTTGYVRHQYSPVNLKNSAASQWFYVEQSGFLKMKN
jgi:hypothetical protein